MNSNYRALSAFEQIELQKENEGLKDHIRILHKMIDAQKVIATPQPDYSMMRVTIETLREQVRELKQDALRYRAWREYHVMMNMGDTSEEIDAMCDKIINVES